MKNYYEILEVNPKASDEIIKKIYKIKVKLNHPDLFQGEKKTKAEEITKELTEAYSILSDKQKRDEYDLELKEYENKNESNINQYTNIIDSLKSENEYLKQVIVAKNNMITSFMDNNQNFNPSINDNYSSRIKDTNMEENKEYKSHYRNDKSYLNSVVFDLKQFAYKISVLLIIIFSLLTIFCILTGNNVFTIIRNML